jgi:hypothetical protein
MANRVIAVVVIAAGSLVFGFGTAEPAAQAQPVVTDEEQIRDVLTRQAEASAAWDLATAAELTCTNSVQQITGLPATGLFGTDIEATLRTDRVAGDLAEQISGATEELRRAMTGAGAANQTTSVHLTSVDNIAVAGDSATADVTMTVESGSNPPQTQVTQAALLRQNGQWCTTV